jgi:hypothetical protein
MNAKSRIAGMAFLVLTGSFIGSVRALDHRVPEADAGFNQGYIDEACTVASETHRQWEWALWCANHYWTRGDQRLADRYYDLAHKGALDWAEYGWEWGTKKGCDYAWGMQGLRSVANHPGSGIPASIKQLAVQNLARLESQNPPRMLHGPWIALGVGNVDLRQFGVGFNGTISLIQGGDMGFEYYPSNPFHRHIDPQGNATPWFGGGFFWTRPTATVWHQGYGEIWVNENDSCSLVVYMWRWDPQAMQYESRYDYKWTRP